MNLRGHAPLHHPGIQLAPLVDVLLLLLIFFLLTWNAARTETELDVKVPKASAAKEKSAPIGDVVVNVKADGRDRKSTRLNSSHVAISYAVFCLKKKKTSRSRRSRIHDT